MDYYKLIYSALEELEQAIKKLTEDSETFPKREQEFIFCRNVMWPVEYFRLVDKNVWYKIIVYTSYEEIDEYNLIRHKPIIAKEILKRVGHQPEEVFRTLQRIQAATTWCLKQANEKLQRGTSYFSVKRI